MICIPLDAALGTWAAVCTLGSLNLPRVLKAYGEMLACPVWECWETGPGAHSRHATFSRWVGDRGKGGYTTVTLRNSSPERWRGAGLAVGSSHTKAWECD